MTISLSFVQTPTNWIFDSSTFHPGSKRSTALHHDLLVDPDTVLHHRLALISILRRLASWHHWTDLHPARYGHVGSALPKTAAATAIATGAAPPPFVAPHRVTTAIIAAGTVAQYTQPG